MIKNFLATIGGCTVLYGFGKLINFIVRVKVQEELRRQKMNASVANP